MSLSYFDEGQSCEHQGQSCELRMITFITLGNDNACADTFGYSSYFTFLEWSVKDLSIDILYCYIANVS